MSAMKMDFICEDAVDEQEQQEATEQAPTQEHDSTLSASQSQSQSQRVENGSAKTTMSALLSSPSPSSSPASPRPQDRDDSDVDMEDEHRAIVKPAPAPAPLLVTSVPLPPLRHLPMTSVLLPPPAKKAKLAVVEASLPFPVAAVDSSTHTDGDGNALSDNENSEEELVEYAPWEDIELNPAVELVNKIVRESLEAGKTYNKSITAKTSQLIAGCDNVLLEVKNLSDAREAARRQASKQQGQQDHECTCGVAMAMLPCNAKTDAAVQHAAQASKRAADVDEITEDQTSRSLYKIEASMERLRELAELIQATSMQGEANLVAKVTLSDDAIQQLHTAVQASATAATAAAIAQERGRSATALFPNRLYSPLQVKKLQEWYYSYPRPLTDELTLMRTILNYRPYTNPFHPGGLTIAHVREWFKRRRYRERIRYVKLAVEAGRDAAAAEEEIDLRIEQRIEHLRAVVDPNELVKDLDKVRAESSMYDGVINSFSRPEVLDAYVSASHGLPTLGEHVSAHGARTKRPRTQDADLDDAIVVKVGTRAEISVLQKRIRSLLSFSRSATNTNALQQVIDVMRSMDVSRDVRVQTGVVADLKKILKVYRKPTLLRKSTIALLESLGISRRVIMDDNAHDEKPAPMAVVSLPPPPKPKPKPKEVVREEVVVTHLPEPIVPDQKQQKKKIQRPMKFSMRQVRALEEWFQERYKPSQLEMEGYLISLNSSPLREPNQPCDVTMTQLRRWFNKRRCLRRPPFALMTQQEVEKAGMDGTGDDVDDPIGTSTAPDGRSIGITHLESADISQEESSDDDDDSSDEE